MLVYNSASRKLSIGKKKGQTMYYAQVVSTPRLTAKAVEDLIVEKTSLTRGDIRHAITSLAEVIRWALGEGIAVDLADLGSFKVEQHSKMVASEAEVNASILKTARVRFYPRHAMRNQARSVSVAVYNSLSEKPKAGANAGASGSASGEEEDNII